MDVQDFSAPRTSVQRQRSQLIQSDRGRELRAKAKNYLSIGLVDEVDESDDVPFSGMKLATQKSNIL